MNNEEISKLIFCVSQRISTIECNQSLNFIQEDITSHIAKNLAEFICSKRLKTRVTDDYLDLRMVLYVATPEEFWKLVNDAAKALIKENDE